MKKFIRFSLFIIFILVMNKETEAQPLTARDPNTGLVIATIGDSTNNALRVNCVTGCGGGGGTGTDINLAEYIGVALGAGNAVHVQPGTGAIWTINFETTTALGGTIASPTVPLFGGFNYYYNNSAGNWLPWTGFDILTGLAEEQVPAVGVYGLVDNVSTDPIVENQVGLLRMSANRNSFIQIRDAALNERGANVNASSELLVNATVNNFPASQTVTATNLDIRDLTSASDSVTSTVTNTTVGTAIAVRCVTTTGAAFESCAGSGGSGGGGQADDTALANVGAVGALYDTSPPAITDGNVGIPRMSTDRYMFTIFPSAQDVNAFQDGTWSVDSVQSGAWSVAVNNFPAVQPVSDNGGSLTVDGTVAVSNFPATQPVSGTVTIQDGGNTITVDGAVTVATHDIGSITTAVVPGVAATNLGKAEDAAHTTGDTTVAVSHLAVDGGAASETANAAGDYTLPAVDRYGAQFARQDHPNSFNCGLDAISTTLTQCQAAPAAGFSIYITTVVAGSTTATAGQFTLRRGTGTNCGTGTASILPSAATVARIAAAANNASGGPTVIPFMTPLRVAAANAVCVLGVATNTVWVQITGFIAR